MKYIFVSKKNIMYILGLFIILILFILLIYPMKDNSSSLTKETFKPLDTMKNNSLDLNADGNKETISIITQNDNDDIEITSDNHTYFLSSLCDNNILSTHSSFWPLSIYIQKLSRNLYPDIIVQGNLNNKPVNYIFTWKDNSFIKVFSNDNNLLGALDLNSNKTPECYTLNSFSGMSSFNSFMILDKEILDTTSDTNLNPDIAIIQSFINVIEMQSELYELPNIFKEGISPEDLSLLWNLDKENNTYSFQNGFFYDDTSNTKGKAASYKWNLNFEKYSSYDNSKSQITIYLTTELINDTTYEISSFHQK
ncbi:hypothetical protein SAMN04487886_101820 [Clostridium sp. DSM 8431]|nr:hypothetical protein SAMN04487886_101820 [Clostridium sp. DSM 8431]